MRIGIAGAGLLGRLVAWALLDQGHTVAMWDRATTLTEAPPAQDPARAAGWTAAGMLSPTAELECANEQVFAWGLQSLSLWPVLLDQLADMGHRVEYAQAGSLLLAHRTDLGAAQRVVSLLTRKAPQHHAPQALSRAQLHSLVPAVHGPAHAWHLPQEGQIHTVQAMAALGHALLARGVQWHGQQSIATLHAGQLVTASGAAHAYDWVFDCRGVGAAPDLPVRGVRGELFWLHAPHVNLTMPLRLLHPRWRVYIVGRTHHTVVVGATEIESEDRSPVSLRSTLELLSAAHSVVPGLAEARLIHQESNLRPAMPDNLPVVVTEPGLTRLNGLFRHGWLLGPAWVSHALASAFDTAPMHPLLNTPQQ